MGNVLCREKRASPRRVYTKGSGPTVYDQNISSSSQLSNPTAKIETPNLSLMNSTITLDPRIFDNGQKTPIPPPRKKRGSTLRKGCSLPPSSSIHSADSDSTGGKSPDDFQSSTQSLPSRKLKVGNKKSDKILGESLSDHLSDEPIDSPPSRASATADEVDKSVSLTMSDKKLSFLLNMLEEEQKQKQSIAEPLDSKQNEDEDDDDDEFYKNKTPIEERLFVARKKVTRHICDDDDHIREFIGSEKDREHEHNHDDHHHNHEELDHVPSNDAAAPKKPERDFSKYQQQNEVTTVTTTVEIVRDVEFVTTVANSDNVVNVRKSLSREILPQPPDVPAQRQSTGANEFISGPIVKVDEITVEKMDEVKKSPKSVNRMISLNLSDGQSSQHVDDLSPQTAPIPTSNSIVDGFNFVPSLTEIHPVVKSDAMVKKVVKFDEPPESDDRTPVEEPLFVARKKVTRHICDDDERIRDFIGNEKDREHHHSHDEHDHIPSHDPSVPKKPERDFSKHQQQNEVTTVTTVVEIVQDFEVVTTVAKNDNVVKVRKSLSRENLPQPPEVPVNRTISLNLSEGQNSQHIEDLSPQTAPILTSKSIVDRFNFVPSCPEIHPVVKSDAVTVKKVVKFNEPPESVSSGPSNSNDDDDDDAITVRDADDVTAVKSQMNSSMNTSMNEIIEEIYSRNSQIMREFHSYLEPPPSAKKMEELLGSKDDNDGKASTSVKIDKSEIVLLRPTKSDDENNVQVIAVKSVETATNSNHQHENNNVDFVRPSGVSEEEVIEDDDDDKRRYSDSFESTDEDELDTERKPKSRKFNKNTTTLVSIQIKADDNNVSDNDKKSTEVASESFSDLPIFKSIVEETISNTREFIREKSPDHSTLLKLLNEKPSNSTSE